MKCDCWDVKVEEYGINKARISLVIPKHYLKELNGLIGKVLEIVIRKKRKARSLNANSYCWVLCDKIARALNDGSTKEDIYRRAIESVGKFEPVLVLPAKVEDTARRWGINGLGWIVKDTGINIAGMRQLFIYYGSSAYTSEEMARLIDWLIEDAESVGCENVLTPAERSRMLEEWEYAQNHKAQRERNEDIAAAGAR